MKSPKPYSVGRIVMYMPFGSDQTESNGNSTDEPLPAIIVRTWQNSGYQNDEVNLKVFTDGPVDLWRTSVPYDQELKSPGTWHWPEIK